MNYPFLPIPLDSQTVLQPDRTADLPEVEELEKDALE